VFLGDNQDTLLVRVGHSYNISDIRNLQNVLDIKAPIDSPTFTGTVAGITKAMVGLGNVDNTSDANKPVSSATQTALDLKANLSSPTLTGTPSAPTATAGTNTTQIATTQFVQSAISAHTHLITLFSSSPTLISNTYPYTTITLNSTITSRDRLLIIWGSNTDVKFTSEVFLINFGGSDYYAVLEKRFDFVAGSDGYAYLSVQMGTVTTIGGYTGYQLTFRNGMFQSLSGTQTAQTMYVQAIYKVVL
jgi:hypothetical protein